MSADALGALKPALVWERFAELTQIARPSKAEGPARDHVLAWAATRVKIARVSEPKGELIRYGAALREFEPHR